jgi:hypothetical protein
MAEDNLPKYVLEIVGFDGVSVRSFAGRASVRKLVLDTTNFQITESAGPGPASLVVSLRGDGTFAALLASLEARVAALEAVVAVRDDATYLKNPQGQTVITLAQDSGQRTIAFFDQTPQPRVSLDPYETTADLAQNIAFELNAKGLTSPP